MSWANLDDRLHGHPKVRKLQRIPFAGAEALGIWCWCLSWCRAYSPTTGKVSVDVVADAWHADPDHVREVFALLVHVKLVDPEVSVEDEYLIHDWTDWQLVGRTQQREAGRARAATAKRDGGRFAPNDPTSSAGALVEAGTSQASPNRTTPNRTSPRARDAGGAGDLSAPTSVGATISEFRKRVPEPGR